jgi:hypothetical protein
MLFRNTRSPVDGYLTYWPSGARVFEIGQARRTAGSDAYSIVMVALRDTGLRHVELDPQLMVLRLLSDRRDELSRARARDRLFLAGPQPCVSEASCRRPCRPTSDPGRRCRQPS